MLTIHGLWDKQMNMLPRCFLPFPAVRLGACLLLMLQAAGVCFAQKTPDQRIQEEHDYVSGLIRLGFPDYAKQVTDKISRIPGGRERVIGLEIKSLIYQKKFDEAKAVLGEMSLNSFENWQSALDAADAYYAVGRHKECQKIYDDFFGRHTAPRDDREAFYKTAAYKYSQMLRFMLEEEKSFAAYGYALRASPTPDEELQIWAEMAQLAMKLAMGTEGGKRGEFILKAKEYAEKVQWKDQGIWFGKTVVVLAQIAMLEEGRAKAAEIILDYLSILKDIHNQLEKLNDPEIMKLTPMAECRYLLGSIQMEEGMELFEKGQEKEGLRMLGEAAEHYYNVFVRFPSTTWAPQAGRKAQDIFNFFDRHSVIYGVPKDLRLKDAMQVQVREARTLMLARDYESAVTRYEDILAVFADYSEGAIQIMSDLAKCYAEQGEEDYARSVSGFIVERYRKNPHYSEAAGDAILSLAKARDDASDSAGSAQLYEDYIKSFTNHPKWTTVVLIRANRVREQGDLDKALGYFMLIKPEHKGYDSALSGIAYIWGKKDEREKELAALGEYVKVSEPGYARAYAEYRIAESLAKVGKPIEAVKIYRRVANWIKSQDEVKQEDPAAIQRNKDLLEATLFNMAAACSQVKEPERLVKSFQQAAIKFFGEFVQKYPQSKMSPGALLRKGILEMVLEDIKEATKTFELLGRDYPDSEEARSMHFLRIQALMEMGMAAEAKKSVTGMLDHPESYSARQFVHVAGMMLKHKQNDLAAKLYAQALQLAPDPVKDRGVIENSLFALGKIHYEAEKYSDVVVSFKALLEKYPLSGYTLEACFMLAHAYAEVSAKTEDKAARFELFNEAIKTLNKVNKFTRDINSPMRDKAHELKAKISWESIGVYKLKIKAAETFNDQEGLERAREDLNAALFRLFMLTDPSKPGVKPYVEEAFPELMVIETAARRWADVIEYAERYIELFPGGKHIDRANNWLEEARKNGGTSADSQATDDAGAGGEDEAVE